MHGGGCTRINPAGQRLRGERQELPTRRQYSNSEPEGTCSNQVSAVTANAIGEEPRRHQAGSGDQ